MFNLYENKIADPCQKAITNLVARIAKIYAEIFERSWIWKVSFRGSNLT